MDPKIKQAIQQLSEVTGIPLSINQEDASWANESGLSQEMLSRIRQVEKAYRETYSEEYYLRSLLKKENDVKIGSRAFFSSCEQGGYVLLLCYDKKQEVDVLQLLKAVYPERKKNFPVRMDDGITAWIRFQEKVQADQLIEEGQKLRDQLRSELLCDCWIGIGKYFCDRAECRNSYEQALRALEIGERFQRQEQVYSYERLGLYRLVDNLTMEICKEYLEEISSKKQTIKLEEELVLIAHCFFEHDLNVSETARALYMHRNTLLHKLDRIEQVTGQDLRTFRGAVTLLLTLMIQQKNRDLLC